MRSARLTRCAVSLLCLFAAGALPGNGTARAGEVAQRQVAMESNGDAMKLLGVTFKGEIAFDGKAVAAAGYTIANNLIASRGLFPEGSAGEDSRAKPDIWQDMEGFLADLDKSVAAATRVAATAEAGDADAFKTVFADLGRTCKGCHDDFRKPKNQ